MASPKSLSNFTRLSENTSFYQAPQPPTPPPPSTVKLSKPLPPTLIILCAWLGGATPRRIDKYTRKYAQLLPYTSILLIRALTPDMTYRSYTTQQENLSPARKIIVQHLSEEKARNPIGFEDRKCVLLHTLSTSGGNTACHLLWSLLHSEHISLYKHINTLILDCQPGFQDFWRGYKSLTINFAAAPVHTRIIGNVIGFSVMGILHPLMKYGVVAGISVLREALWDEEAFGPVGVVKRLYLYSKEDEVMDWRAIAEHAKEGREMGVKVESVVFETGHHCALPLMHEERYWGAITDLWNSGDSVVDGREVPVADVQQDLIVTSTKATLPPLEESPNPLSIKSKL